MKILKSLFITMLMVASSVITAQTADEIIDTYLENTGGKENWKKVEGLKMVGMMKMQGMEIPFEQMTTKDGKQVVAIEIQGNKMTWSGFDGNVAWQRNQMTMEAEESDNEATENLKNELKEFPDPFIDYKEKGYKVELIGKETVDGTETFKIKLTKKPIMVNGEEKPNIRHYYFDTENYVPIILESEVSQGPMKGQVMRNALSDYEEINGLYFPLTISNKFQTMQFKEVTINPEIDASEFEMPQK